jgi:hypothetical protein
MQKTGAKNGRSCRRTQRLYSTPTPKFRLQQGSRDCYGSSVTSAPRTPTEVVEKKALGSIDLGTADLRHGQETGIRLSRMRHTNHLRNQQNRPGTGIVVPDTAEMSEGDRNTSGDATLSGVYSCKVYTDKVRANGWNSGDLSP